MLFIIWNKRLNVLQAVYTLCVSSQDILKQATDDGLTNANELPYFDGDFWPNALEDSIRELDQEAQERAAAAAAETSDKEVIKHPTVYQMLGL